MARYSTIWAANMDYGQYDSNFIQVIHHMTDTLIKTSTKDRSMHILWKNNIINPSLSGYVTIFQYTCSKYALWALCIMILTLYKLYTIRPPKLLTLLLKINLGLFYILTKYYIKFVGLCHDWLIDQIKSWINQSITT